MEKLNSINTCSKLTIDTSLRKKSEPNTYLISSTNHYNGNNHYNINDHNYNNANNSRNSNGNLTIFYQNICGIRKN